MQIPLKRIQWVEFHEHPISHPKNVKVELFEIYSKGLVQSPELHQSFNHPLYCKLLLEKVLKLNSLLLSRFLDYQCKLLNRPYSWLTALDMLLEFNVDLLLELNSSTKLNDGLNLVNEKRTEYQQVPRLYREDDFGNENPYRFELVKKALTKIKTKQEKRNYLLRIKTDYLQNKYNYDKEDGVDFDVQIDLELDFLKEMVVPEEESTSRSNIIWNGQINQLVDVFFQFLQMKIGNGDPLMETSNEQLITVITNTFCKKDWSRFSAATIRTILKPTRYDKRPKGNKKIDIEMILKKSPKGTQENE
jgi:hypothetical protein